jgi:hypothetical protein
MILSLVIVKNPVRHSLILWIGKITKSLNTDDVSNYDFNDIFAMYQSRFRVSKALGSFHNINLNIPRIYPL